MFGEEGKDEGAPQSTRDVLKSMMKNPKKIMELLKTVSSKLDNKMKSGELLIQDKYPKLFDFRTWKIMNLKVKSRIQQLTINNVVR